VDTSQPDLFGRAIPEQTQPAASPVTGRSRRAAAGGSASRAAEVLSEIAEGRYGVLDTSDRIVVFEEDDRVRHATDEDVIASLMSQGYVTEKGVRDTVSCRHGAIRRPVTPLRLTPRGRQLLSRWSALKPIPAE
jgi:hypothetical protein